MTSRWVRPDRPLVIAHRGLRAHVPEQTMASFRAAIEHGAEMIEADALLSRDRELVLMHDDTVDRTTNGHGFVREMTWAELAELDAGTWFEPKFAGLRIPRVAELIELARDAGIGLCLEAKGATPDEAARVAIALATLIADRDAVDWAFVSSFDHEALSKARESVPALLIAPERLPEHGPQPTEETVRQAIGLGTSVLQHRWELITPSLLEALHEAGVAVWAWNTNDAESVRSTMALGVDGIIGDDVDLLVAGRVALEQSNGRAPAG
jgi:glycerophosphoryl diester phosphodiesterase